MSKQTKIPFTIIVSLLLWLPSVVHGNSLITSTVKNPDPYSNNQSWFRYYEGPGSTINDAVELSNVGNETKTVKLYATDATSNQAGSFTPKMLEDKQNGIGSWTKLEQDIVTLAPNQSLEVRFTINIPKDISPGQYFGSIINEEDKDLSPCPTIQNVSGSCQGNIQIKTRTGNRVYLTVPGEINQDIKMDSFTWKSAGKKGLHFLFSFTNKGNVAFQPKAVISIYDQWGNKVATLENTLGKSLPGTTITPMIDWNYQNKFGNFYAKAQIYYLQDDQGQFDNLHGTVLTESSELSFLIFPWVAFLVLVIILLLAGFGFIFRYYYYQRIIDNSREYQVKENDDLVSIAKQFHTNWRLIACINKIKAPYNLTPKQKIKVPQIQKSKHEK